MKKIPFKSSAVRSTVKGVLLGSTVALPMMAAAFPASAAEKAEVEQLKAQVQALEDKVAALGAEQETTDVSRAGMTIGNTTFELGGYIKLDAVYDFEADQGASLGPSDVIGQLGGDEPEDPHLGFTAKQTRLTISTTTDTAAGDIGGYIEMDMYGEGFSFDGGGEPRLRQAYLTYGNWLIGRAWTTFSDFHYGTSLNFYGPQGQIFARQEQIRYTFRPSENTNFAVAIEDAGTGILDATGTTQIAGEDSLPDLAARFQTASGPFSFQAAALARQFKTDIGGNDDETAFGWGLNLGGSLALPTGTTLMLTLAGGDGVGRYVYAPAGAPGAYVTSNGELETIERWGGIATISQALTSTVTANLMYGIGTSDAPEEVTYATGGFHDQSATWTANLLYTPVENLLFGIEYDRVTYETQSGADADTDRIQFATQYSF